MAPLITVIADPTKPNVNVHIISTLEKHYPCLVDGINYQPLALKQKYSGINGMFFGFDLDELIMFEVDTVDLITPNFVITFDKDTKVKRKAWVQIYKWVKSIFEGSPDEKLNEFVATLIPKPVPLPEKMSIAKMLTKPIPEPEVEYKFRFHEIPEKDSCLVEIVKPYTDLPYTVHLKAFTENGFLYLFTDLFICTSWGVCSKDAAFLNELWKYLKMDLKHGALDLENRLKAAISRCTPSEGYVPVSEPEVYRLTIEQVLEKWCNKRKAFLLTEEE